MANSLKNMTLRGVDSQLAAKLREEAEREGKSVNQAALDALRKQFGLSKPRRFTEVHRDLDHLFGRGTRRSSPASSRTSSPAGESIRNCGGERVPDRYQYLFAGNARGTGGGVPASPGLANRVQLDQHRGAVVRFQGRGTGTKKKPRGTCRVPRFSTRVGLSCQRDTAQFYAEILDRLRTAGTPIPTNEVWIAAQAMEQGLRLVSLDRHFASVAGLLLLTPGESEIQARSGEPNEQAEGDPGTERPR